MCTLKRNDVVRVKQDKDYYSTEGQILSGTIQIVKSVDVDDDAVWFTNGSGVELEAIEKLDLTLTEKDLIMNMEKSVQIERTTILAALHTQQEKRTEEHLAIFDLAIAYLSWFEESHSEDERLRNLNSYKGICHVIQKLGLRSEYEYYSANKVDSIYL